MLNNIMNKELNAIDYSKITKDIIINANNDNFEFIKNYIIIAMKEMFSLYSYNSIKKGSKHNLKWTYEKCDFLERMNYLYKVIYTDMFERTSQYNNDDITYFQLTFNKLFNKNKTILNGFITD